MRFFKRILSIILALCMLSGLLIGFSGCSNNTKTLTIGQYLTKVVDKFGMISYQTNEPHIESITEENEFFEVVQMAYEHKLIDDSDLDLNAVANKGFVANTLVKAVGFADTESMTYDDIAQFAADNGYIMFDYRGRTDNEREVLTQEIDESLDASFYIWTNRNYEPVQEIKWKDGVTDFEALADSDIYNLENNKIGISREKYNEIISGSDGVQKGEIFIMPPTSGLPMQALKATNVQLTDDYAVITYKQATDAEIESVLENMECQDSFDVDFSKAVITDGLGNPITVKSNAQNMNSFESPSVGYIGSDVSDADTKDVDFNVIDFEVDGIKVKGGFQENSEGKWSVNFSLDGTLSKTQNGSMTLHKSYNISDLHVDKDHDFKGFSLQYAYMNLKYKTTDTTKLDFSYEKSGTFAPEHTNGNGKFPSNFKRAILKDSEAKGAKNIKVCNITAFGNTLASVRLVVEVHISVSGHVTLTVTQNNLYGFDYRKGEGVKFIKDESRENDLEAHGQAEAGIYIGAGLFAFGTSLNILGGGFEFSIGMIVDVKAHMSDSENRLYATEVLEKSNSDIAERICNDLDGVEYQHEKYGTVKLKCYVCSDIKTYWKIWAGLDSGCKVAKILKLNAEKVWGGPEEGIIDSLCFHFEDGKRVGSCTRQFTEVETTTEPETTTEEYTGTNILQVEDYYVNVVAGGSETVKIESLPEGYSNSDIVYESEDNSVATVDASGRVYGKSEGTVVINVKTSDNKFSVTCTINVVAPGTVIG